MSALENLQVFKALNSSPNARLELSAELGDGLSAALWSNHHDAQDYEAPAITPCPATSAVALRHFAVASPAPRAVPTNCASCPPSISRPG